MTFRHLIAPIFILALLAFPGLAQASADDVLRDCAEDNYLDGKYSNKEKRAALRKMPGEMKEYTDCEEEIRASIDSGKANKSSSGDGFGEGGGSGGGFGGSFDPDTDGDGVVSPAERDAAKKRKRQLAQLETERKLGDRQVDSKDASGFQNADATNGLSLPAILALIALSLLTLGAGLYVMRRRNPELLRRIPLPSIPNPFRRS